MVQDAGATGRIAGRNQNRRLVLAAGRQQVAANHEKTRGVVRPVLDVVDQNLEIVDIGGSLRSDRRRAVFVARPPRAGGIARHADQLDVRQILANPAATLCQRLLMRTNSLDLVEAFVPGQQVLFDAQLDLTARSSAATSETCRACC